MSIRTVADRMKKQNELLESFTESLSQKLNDLTAGDVSPAEYRLKVTEVAEKIKAVTPEPGDLLEEKKEKKFYDDMMLTTLQQIATNTGGGAGSSGGGSGSGGGGGKIAGAFAGAIGSGLGAGMKLFAGLAGLGFGIAGFFTGLSLGDKAQALINTDMEATKKNMIALGEAFAMTPTKGLLAMGVAAAIGAKFGSIKGAMGMTFFGLGLSGFFTGLALGDKGAALLDIDGAGLATIMGSLASGLNSFSGKSLVALGGLFALSRILGASSAILLPAMGVGLAGFFTALAGIGDGAAALGIDGSGLVPMLSNIAEGLGPLSELNGGNLIAVGAGIAALAGGMALLLGADWISSIGDWVGSLFGKDDEDDIFARTAKSVSKLNDIDVDPAKLESVGAAAETFGKLAGALDTLQNVDMKDIKKRLISLGDVVAFSIPMFDAMENGGVIGEKYFDGRKEMRFEGANGEPMGLKDISMESIQKIGLVSQGTSLSSSVGSDSSMGLSPTSSNNMSTLIRENNETKNNAPVVIMDNSTQNNSSGGGGGGTSIVTGRISPFDTYDPYNPTRA